MDDVVQLSGNDVVRVMWPLNEMFRSRLRKIRSLKYDPLHEAEVDAALVAYGDGDEIALRSLGDGAWRVLLERHLQLIEVALANEAAGNPMISLPAGMPDDVMRGGLMLMYFLRMELPFPPRDLTHHEFEADPPLAH